MSYERFAFVYDDLMQDAPYEQWVSFTERKLAKYGVEGRKMLDLACGTGEISIRFAKKGYDVAGVDLSSEMLSVAQTKMAEAGLSIPLYLQDMAELDGFEDLDFAGIYCDSLNYLQTEDQVKNTFKKVFKSLKSGGAFFFDIHSTDKIEKGFVNQTFTLNEDRIAYIWNSFQGQFPYSVEHEISFFVLDERSGKYDRFDEVHFQRTYPIQQYSQWLREAGFESIEVNADFTDSEPKSGSERIFFSARKI